MAPVKRRPHTRSHHKMKVLRRMPNISKLVYKFLRLHEGKEDGESLPRGSVSRCSFCKRRKRREEVLDSADSWPDKKMANKRKPDSARNSKSYRVKRRQTSREQTLSASMHKGNRGEGLREMKRYIQKAIDFGVESGYLIPKDATYKVLRVSSGLLNDVNYASKVRKSDGRVSHARQNVLRQTPHRFDEYEVQDARRRRSSRRRSRKRRRSRSGSRRRRKSRRRGRRRSGSATGEEVIDLENDNGNDNDNESDFEAQPEKRSNTENTNRGETTEQPNQSDRDKASDKAGDDDGSDLSIDEDESDDEDRKKREDANKS